LWLAFFFSKCHTKHKPKTKRTQHQCSSAFSNGSSVVVAKVVEKNSMVKKKKFGKEKRKCQKTEDWGRARP